MTERFTLLSELGRGGMGVVWKARDEETGMVVALKLLREVYAEDPDYVTRFERELELAKRIHSRNVVQVLGYGVRDGTPYLALEYVDGPSLRDRLTSHGPYSWPEAKALLAQIAQGLADAHAAGVIHRDLKPSNVLIGSDGIAKIADFGIAKGLDLTRVTGTSTLLGTPAYLAPEGPADERSDLYGLGVIAYELLTGVVPFEGRTYQEVILRHVREAPDLDKLPPDARPIVGWLLAKDAAERPKSAHELLPVLYGAAKVPTDVRASISASEPATAAAGLSPTLVSEPDGGRVRASGSVSTPPSAAVYPSARRRSTPLMVGLGAVGLVVCLLAVTILGSLRSGSATTPPSSTPTASVTANPVTALTSGPTATAASATLAGPVGACTVGVSWNNYQEERWAKWDEPAIKAALAAGGATYISSDANASAATQGADVANLIGQGAKVVIIVAQDGTAIRPAVTEALNAGVAVISYDRLIEDPGALYITFDNVLVGHMQAAAVFAAKPKGNYVVIKGNKLDANAAIVRSGMDQVIKPAVTSGDIKIVGETYTDNWDPTNAYNEMTQFLTVNSNKVDAVLSENDGMAGGVVAALEAQGLAGKVPVSGMDGDAAALNRVAIGTQTVDVWKDPRMLGKAAGDAAVAMCAGTRLANIKGVVLFKSPGGNSINSILLAPLAVTKDNLHAVLDAGWIDKATLCQGVTAGSVNGC